MKANLIGIQLKNALKEFQPLPLRENLWLVDTDKNYDVRIGEQIFLAFPRSYVAADGTRVLLHNSQLDVWRRPSLERRARHLFMYSDSANAIDRQRARYLPNVPQCLGHAQFIIQDPVTKYRLYGARFASNSIQLVCVEPKRNPKGPDAVAAYLISQFVFDGGGRQKHFPIVWVAPELP